jgi:hypothetical protein
MSVARGGKERKRGAEVRLTDDPNERLPLKVDEWQSA